MSIELEGDHESTAPIWAAFGDLMSVLLGAFVLILVGVIIGLSLFGFMGIIFGPLLISVFILCVDIFKKEYIEEGVSVDNEILPDEVVPGDGQVKDEE